MKIAPKMKSAYAVLCHRIDCGDESVFLLEDGGEDSWPSVAKARKAMKKDYETMCDEYSPDWSADGKDPCNHAVTKDEIFMQVPIWDGEKEKDSWILCHWKIVQI